MTKEELLKELRNKPREMFAILSDDNFKKAKEFWGEGRVLLSAVKMKELNGKYKPHAMFMPIWKFNLRRMVLKKNPIKCIEEFNFGKKEFNQKNER